MSGSSGPIYIWLCGGQRRELLAEVGVNDVVHIARPDGMGIAVLHARDGSRTLCGASPILPDAVDLRGQLAGVGALPLLVEDMGDGVFRIYYGSSTGELLRAEIHRQEGEDWEPTLQ